MSPRTSLAFSSFAVLTSFWTCMFWPLVARYHSGHCFPSFPVYIPICLLLFFAFFTTLVATMSISARRRFRSHRKGSPDREGSLARYPPPFEVDSYIGDHRSQFDSQRFAAMRSHGPSLLVLSESGPRDPAESG